MARWGVAIRRVFVRTALVVAALVTLVSPAAAAVSGAHSALALDASTPPVVPGYVPFALFLGLETLSVLASALVFARRRPDDSNALRCSRCARLHERTEAFGRVADAVAVGALAFLVALPFVAAGYESGFTFANTVLAASAVVAVVAAAAEADFLARAVAARVWPHVTWSADATRIIGGGARWLGVLLALDLFQTDDRGIVAIFGGAGRRLVLELGSWTILSAAAILAGAFLVALVARWIVPMVFGSVPTAFAAYRAPHGTAG